MARCGCGTTNATTCMAIVECIAANLGPGLEYVGGQIQVRLSRDPDNITTTGTDGGIYTPAEAVGPGEQTWPKTVATLPALAMEATGGGNGVGPSTSPYLIEYCIDNDIDMYDTTVVLGADGVAIDTLQGANGSVTVFTDNPGPLAWGQASALTMSQINYDAGTRVNPTGENSHAPASLLTPSGGWAGFYENQYTGRSVAELLRLVRGRIVVELRVNRLSVTSDQIEQCITATVQAVVDAGAQDWCIVSVPGYLDDGTLAPIAEWVPLVTSQGITAAVNLIPEAGVPTPQPAAAIVASGATWVAAVRDDAMSDTVTDARITSLVAAGLEVIARTTSRHYWTTYNLTTLGVRAVEGSDAVYARGARGQAGDLAYRQTFIPGLETRTSISGALTPVTDEERALWSGGFARSDLPGRWFQPRYGWVDGVSRFGNNQLLGTICPIPDTVNFEFRLRVHRHGGTTASAGRWAGIYWGAVDDRDPSNTPGGPSNPLRDGYACVVHEITASGFRQRILRYDNGAETTLSSTMGGPGWLANNWVTLIVTVTGAGINFQAVGPSSSAVLSTSNGTYRGPYAFYFWNDAGAGSATQYHGYDNANGLVMYEAQS